MRSLELEMQIALGMRIKCALGKHDVDKVAKRVGVSRTAIYNWMAGANEPSLFRLALFARATKTNFAWLATGQGRWREERRTAPDVH